MGRGHVTDAYAAFMDSMEVLLSKHFQAWSDVLTIMDMALDIVG